MSVDAYLGRRVEELQAANGRLLRKLEKQRLSQTDLVDAVRQAVTDACTALKLPAVPKPKADRRSRTAETAVAVLSDWQLAKVTPTYSTAVCERRVGEYASRVETVTALHRSSRPVRELRVYLLGDIVEGELIFPGQPHLIDASLYRQVTVDGPRILATFLRRMAGLFAKVHVVGVIGNHGAMGGRARRDYHPESNADAMMYEVTRLLLRDEPRISWAENFTPGERHWNAVDQIGSKRFFLFHGDQIKGGFAGWPWYGFGKKLLGWRDAIGFDYSLSGHFHTPVRFKVGGLTHWGNGTTESSNTYALEQLAAQGTPSQWLFYVHPDRGVTAEYEIHLT